MDLKADFSFRPLPAIAEPVHLPFPNILDPLGPLHDLPGTWTGTGFNTIWRPFFPKSPEDEFLELNITTEKLDFAAIGGPIPNRGFLQQDINMFGLTYMQQISDKNVGGGLHAEPGIWATAPATTNPAEPPTVVRMASIPHGTTILAQGQSTQLNGAPVFPAININPIPQKGGPAVPFPQQNLAVPTRFRSQPPQTNNITQAMIDNPNSVLAAAIQGQTITATTVLQVTTKAPAPITGGGTSNTSFLVGGPQGPNANTTSVVSTFWIEHVAATPAKPAFLQLQYSQTVMLLFDDFFRPRVTVGTLAKQAPTFVPATFLDPRLPGELLDRIHAANAPKPAV